MPTDIDIQDITAIAKTAALDGFTGNFTELGGGEVNDTFVLDCGNEKVILRVTRYTNVNTLQQEAKALSLLNLDQVPKLIYFNEEQRIKNRGWIIESYISGMQTDSLSLRQFEKLGELLAEVHKVKSQNTIELSFWENFLDASKHFGDEPTLLNHPDSKLNKLIHRMYKYLQQVPTYSITPSLIHGDVTLGNLLIDGDNVSLIDWEFSKFKDPLSDFSTIYYEDMEYNNGKWRIHIKEEEKAALFEGYTKAGGIIDKERLKVWLNVDKLGAAAYLYWKMYQSGHAVSDEATAQYKVDLNNLTESLDRNL